MMENFVKYTEKRDDDRDVRLNAAIRNILGNLATVLELTDGDETDVAFLRDILPVLDKQECIPEEVRRGIQDCLSRIVEESIYGKDTVRQRYPYVSYVKPYAAYRSSYRKEEF